MTADATLAIVPSSVMRIVFGTRIASSDA